MQSHWKLLSAMLSPQVQFTIASDVCTRIFSLYNSQGAKYDSGKLLQGLSKLLPPSGVKNINVSFLNFYAGEIETLEFEELTFEPDERMLAFLTMVRESEGYAYDEAMIRRKVDTYADLLMGELFIPLRGVAGQTPPGTPDKEALHKGEDFLDAAHFIPHGAMYYPNLLKLLDIMDPGFLPLLEQLGIESLENAIALMHSLRLELNNLWVYLEAVPHQANTYDVKWTRDIEHELPLNKRITIRDHSYTNLPVPHPRLVAMHATCAKVLQFSGAGNYIEELLSVSRGSGNIAKMLEPLFPSIAKGRAIPPPIELKRL